MLNISLSELIIIASIGLLLFKPREFPEIARKIGEFVAKIKSELAKAKKELDLESTTNFYQYNDKFIHKDTHENH